MARLCNSKSPKLGLMGTIKENQETPSKCMLNMEFPPILSPEDLYPGIKKEKSKLYYTQNPAPKGKLRFQCHYEDRKKRAEFRRKKIIQKLKKNYAIDVEGLNEDVTREIIMKAEMIEKEKRQREKRNIERMVTMISKLLEEQRYKTRDFPGTKIYPPPWRKALKNLPKCMGDIFDKELQSDKPDEEVKNTIEGEGEWETLDEVTLKSIEPKHEAIIAEEEEIRELPKCIEKKHSEEPSHILSYPKLIQKHRSSCVSVERCLESTPKKVVFNGYIKDKVYLQEVKITNIGLETIHCRYLGIVVHTKGEDRFPIGVAVRDNVKLRPGLCCSTKIRLCSKEDTKELQCSVVYETRRQTNPLHHSWFFVPVVCFPVRAKVKVTPLKLTFPSLTWCEATGREGARLLHKTLKFENSGGKACWCRISNITSEPFKEVSLEIGGELGEADGEIESLKTKSNNSEVNISQNKSFVYSEEFDGEGYSMSLYYAEETAVLLIEELFENVFAAFRFSAKYCIDIPPNSTVLVDVRFIPNYKGFHHEVYFIQFEDCENWQEQTIELVGNIKQIPLKVEPQVIDLKTCIANSGVYTGTFKVFNDSKGPYSVVLKVPSSIKEHAHVYPRATTILPLNSSDFSVRIYPRVTLARDAPGYYNENSQVLEFPIYIHPSNVGACKRDCIKIYVFALITNYSLELSPPSINFGTVTTLETVRTELELTNHSLAMQEYGFLNLPEGVRVEPNMGFGRILPKETITLYLLYSPVEDCDEAREFQVAVTSIAKYGGFREKLESVEESAKYTDLFWGEDLPPFDIKSSSGEQTPYIQTEDSDDYDVCEDESSIEGEELSSKIHDHEKKIREFLHLDTQKTSQHSYLKTISEQSQELKACDLESRQETYSEYGEFDEYRDMKGSYELRPDSHIVSCRAYVVQPRCRFSETVIRLPSTSCSSFSLYRFRLECLKENDDINCSCGFRRTSKCVEKSKFQCSFEFQYSSPHIKLEPESGFIKPRDSLPVTIIYRPEFPVEQMQYESRLSKAQKSVIEAAAEKERISSISSAKQSKGKQFTPKNKTMEKTSSKNTTEEMINIVNLEREDSDIFAGEKSLAKLINPFNVETKVQCVIKSKSCDDRHERREIHEMVLICPAIKPNFIYLGNSQEIKFNKVFVGTKSKMILEIQNISLERMSPSATLLNPVGPFFCPAGLRKVEVDPEHIWQQPLIYAPLEEKGIEKQFFEIYCEPTNILLTVSGEAVKPEYRIIPNFGCCLMEVKPGNAEDLKLEIENLSPIIMNIHMVPDYIKHALDLRIHTEEEKVDEDKTAKKPVQKEDGKDRRKSKNSGNENFQFWDEVPEMISSTLEHFEDLGEEEPNPFTLLGVDDDIGISIPPTGKQQIRIQFKSPEDKEGDKKYLIKYSLKLERFSTLKEILVMGKIFRAK